MLKILQSQARAMYDCQDRRGHYILSDKTKYHSRKCEWMGIRFDSIKERNRWIVLHEEEKAGRISNLRRQVVFVLLPHQYQNGRLVEREVKYIADFVYQDRDGNTVVEDTKGFKTREYILKRKLMLFMHKIIIQEV